MTDTSIISPRATTRVDNFVTHVDWSSILAGAAIACAITAVMTAFGAAIGLSMVSPYGGAPKWGVALAVGIWVLWITVSSFAAGGYVCGRMRTRLRDATEHESHIRDGAHGLVVWAIAVLVGAWLISPTSMSGKSNSTANGSSTSTTSSFQVADPIAYSADMLLRSERAAPTGIDTEATRREVTRALSASIANGTLAADDRAYLDRVVVAQSGLPAADADRRVNEAVAQAKAGADRARKTGILIGFLTAASLVLGAAAAWWGASVGGRHRDENYDVSHWTRW
jgi:hypothetical protein